MTDNQHSQYGQKLISWEFSEFNEYERSRGWYILAIIAGVFLLLYAILTADFLFAMIIVIAAVILFLRHSAGAKKVVFTIYEDGIRIGGKIYEFKEIKDFYVIYEPPQVKNLYFDFKSMLQPRLQIPLDDINPIKVREILLDYLEEDLEQENEPISDGLGRIFKL